MLALLIYIGVIAIAALIAVYVANRTIPGEANGIVKIVIGAVALIAIAIKVLPLAGIG